ncbi:MAG TPA: hypothetical protein VG826_36110 [Pirellulales bacterium]|nr:hypothetical protein [Pirellulales bacterium]
MNPPLRALNVAVSVFRWTVWKAALLTPAVALSFAWAVEREKSTPTDPLHEIYRDDGEKCSFSTAEGEPLRFVNEPIMRWSTDDD